MAYVYVSTKKDAQKVAGAVLRHTGYAPTVFKDGRSYRVQENSVGNERMEEVLRKARLSAIADKNFA